MFTGETQQVAAAGSDRLISGFISRYEANILRTLAELTPKSVTPDHLTVLGVVGALICAVGMCASNWSPAFLWLGLIGLGINWLGDSLDGSIARYRRIERPRYGFFVDHLSDVVSQILIVGGLSFSPYLRFDVVSLALVAYLALTIYTLVKLHVTRSMQLTYFGVGPTEVRIIIAIGIVLAATTDMSTVSTPVGFMTVFDIAAVGVAVFAFVSGAVMFATDLHTLALLEPSVAQQAKIRSMIELAPPADLGRLVE